MKPPHLFYLFAAHEKVGTILFYSLACSLVIPLALLRHDVSQQSTVASTLPIPGTYRASPKLHMLPAAVSSGSAAVLTASATISSASSWPLHGLVTTEFGASDYPYQSSHTGIDISSRLPAGTSRVIAYRTGVVFSPTRGFGGYGNLVALDHGGGLTSYYGHLSSLSVQPGQTVNAGDVIGIEGSTGNSTGPHLHFEIRQKNIPVNPRRFIDGNP